MPLPSPVPNLHPKRPTLAYLTGPMIYDRFMISGMLSHVRDSDVNLFIFSGGMFESPHGFDAQRAVIFDLINPEVVDGLILSSDYLGHYIGAERINAFCQKFAPIPMVKNEPFLEGVPCIVADFYHGMYTLVTHMIEVHHYTRIAFIKGSDQSSTGSERFQAYCDALRDHGIPYDDNLVAPGTFYAPSGQDAVRLFLDQRGLVPQKDLQAIVSTNDFMALDVLRELQLRGLRVPEDLALTGFDDEEETSFANPPLTTVHIPLFRATQYEIDLVLALIRGDKVPDRISIPSNLVVRRSCGCSNWTTELAVTPPSEVLIPVQDERADQADRLWLLSEQINRPNLLSKMGAVLYATAMPGIHRIDETFLNVFLEELEKGPGKFSAMVFLDRLRPVIAGIANPVRNIGSMHKVLLVLRREVLALLNNPNQRQRFEDMCQMGQVLISDLTEYFLGQQKNQTTFLDQPLSDLIREMTTVLEPQDLMDILAKTLPRIGISACYISLYQDPQHPTHNARLVMGYNERGRMDLGAEGLIFPSCELIPEDMLDPDRPHILIVEPLYFQKEQMGFAIFETGTVFVGIYDSLRDQISSTLKRIDLHHEAEQALKAAESANILKSRFLTTVGHELRTPISMIVSMSELLLNEHGGGQETHSRAFQRELDVIHATGQHLHRLLRDVLDLGASQLGQLQLEFETVDTDELISEAAVVGEQLAREKGLRWKMSIPTRLPRVRGDRTRLLQILLNLLSNACKFTSQGEVELEVWSVQDKLSVSVRDTGLGIPPKEQSAIFNEFKQSERTTARGYGGMGLGLAITRQLVEMHGGKIDVFSTGQEGSGTTFTFSIPVLAPLAPQPAPKSKLLAPGDAAPIVDKPYRAEMWDQAVVLVTDREKENDLFVSSLNQRGYKTAVLNVGASERWLEELMGSPPGAVILDCDPHVVWGTRLLKMLKENISTRDLPVLFYAFDGERNNGSFLELDFMDKPLGSNALLKALEKRGLETKFDALSPPVILVVDDEPAVLEMHASRIQKQIDGSQVLKAHNGVEALEMMRKNKPDLVLLDLMMPDMDGFGVMEKMKGMESTRDIPIIVLTGRVLTEDVLQSFSRGVKAVLGKGIFTMEEILAQVDTVLTRSKHLGSEGQRIARRAVAFIHAHYSEPILRKDIADYIGVNERYMTHCFSTEVGITPTSYLNRYRVKIAAQLLDASSKSITEIGFEVGFASNAYFSRVFLKEKGVSPRDYLHRKA
jgi:signal transduction histidine kinase/DNA-binding LacI/PurR family transcriptional regulator/DNA-binding response OmpR family regulator